MGKHRQPFAEVEIMQSAAGRMQALVVIQSENLSRFDRQSRAQPIVTVIAERHDGIQSVVTTGQMN